MPTSQQSSTADLLSSNHPTTIPSAPTSGGSLLDMDGPHYNHSSQQQSSSAHHDFLGMTAPAAPSHPPAGYGQQQPRPPPQQQAPPQQQQRTSNAFDGFSTQNNQGPFGDLNWS